MKNYADLRRLAGSFMRRERPDHTLQPTALADEACIRLIRQRRVDWQSRAHFFAVAARIMFRILVDHARRHSANVPLNTSIVEKLPVPGRGATDLLVIAELLSRLAERYPRHARIVEMRYFNGLSEKEIADVLKISLRTVKRDWQFARAWLYAELTRVPHAVSRALKRSR